MVRSGLLSAASVGLRVFVALFALSGPPADAASFPLAAGQNIVGSAGVYIARAKDTLLDVARDYDLGYGQLMAANSGTNPWNPGAGRRVTLPSVYIIPEGPRKGIVINLAEQRLYYFPPDGRTVETYPIGVGVDAGMTPLGTTVVVAKKARPTWYPPPSIRAERPELPKAIPPGPDNPLGEYALRLGWSGFLIHGTHKPDGVGRLVSHGCIRLYPEDIERLFSEVQVGAPVRVINDEIRLAWFGDQLYLAVMPSRRQTEDIDYNRPVTLETPIDLVTRVAAAARGERARIDWQIVDQAGRGRTGMPIRITRPVISSTTPDDLPLSPTRPSRNENQAASSGCGPRNG